MLQDDNVSGRGIKITLGSGKEVEPFNTLTLNQSINEHHSFEVRCYHNVFESKDADVISATQNVVGDTIAIIFKPGANASENIFKGVITEVGMIQGEHSSHEIVLKGYGNTILLESGPKLKSFLQKSVLDTVREVVQSSSALRFEAGSTHSQSPLNYIAQFNESDFQFIRRLASIHGEWFYYDGEKLHFGECSSVNTINLQYQRDLLSLSTNMGAAPLKFKDYSYNSGFEDNNPAILDGEAPGSTPGADNFGQKMHSKSNQIFPDTFNFMPRHLDNTNDGLTKFTKSYHDTLAANLVHIQASGNNMQTSIGSFAEIKTEKGNSYGKYFITAITHHADGMGNYSNSFTGIPSTLKTLPNPYLQKPNADFELAKIVDNADPEKHGRVKVKFMWMQGSEQTHWIPTTQLYGGEADFKNRGMVFIPEIGDDVLVGFERGDCDKPYVSQAFMNSKAIETEDRDNGKNLKKSISTRDNRIAFHDKGDGGEIVGIAISVYSGDSTAKAGIAMTDDGEAKIVMGAIDQLTIKTRGDEVVILMKKDGSIKVTGKNINVEAEETLTFKAKDIKMEATGKIEAKANQDVKVEAMGKLELKATKDITATASMNVKIKGTINAEVEGSAGAKLKGAVVDVEASGITNIKGGMVMIN